MWRVFGKRESNEPEQPINYSATPDDRLVMGMQYFLANISASKDLEAARNAPGLIWGRGFMRRESMAEADHEHTNLLAIVIEMRKRIDRNGIEQHQSFAPFHQIVSTHFQPDQDRSDPVSREVDARFLASSLSQAVLGTATAGRPLPMGGELAAKSQLRIA